jgi:Uma2 family endonuclease
MPAVLERGISGSAFPALGYPFDNGDRMDQTTFHKLYRKADERVRAELIEGVVYLKMPTRLTRGMIQTNLLFWAKTYTSQIPTLEARSEVTTKMNAVNEPEPDLFIFVRPECGGQVSVDDEDFIVGAPELIIEIANSTMAVDLGDKKRGYEASGVLEYCVVLGLKKVAKWYVRDNGEFVEKTLSRGVLQSQTFPGLWLDTQALFKGDVPQLMGTLKQGMKSLRFKTFLASERKKISQANGHSNTVQE